MAESEPGLPKLAGAYFDQDYEVEADTPEGNVELFVADHPRSTVDLAISEISQVLSANPSEAQLEKLWIDDYEASFEPRKIGLTYRQWFERMLEILRAG